MSPWPSDSSESLRLGIAWRATWVRRAVVVLGPLSLSADALFKDVNADSDGEGGKDEERRITGNAGADDIRVGEPKRGRCQCGRYLSGLPGCHCRLESHTLEHGGLSLKNPWLSMAMNQGCQSMKKSRASLGCSCAWTLASGRQLRCLVRLINWLVRKMAGSSHGLERTIRDLDALEAHVRLACFSLCLDQLKAFGVFVRGKRRDTTLWEASQRPIRRSLSRLSVPKRAMRSLFPV